MALMARPVTQTSVAGAASARMTVGGPSVASYKGGQIDELSPSSVVSFDLGGRLLPEDFGRQLPGRQTSAQPEYRSGRGRGPVPTTTTNATFDALFRLTEFTGVEVQPKPAVKGPKGFGGLLAKAVGTYEHNAKVIYGQIVPRGQQLRLAV